MRLEWTWEIHWESRQPEEAESKRLICRQQRALHTEAAAADSRAVVQFMDVDRTFHQLPSPQAGLCTTATSRKWSYAALPWEDDRWL